MLDKTFLFKETYTLVMLAWKANELTFTHAHTYTSEHVTKVALVLIESEFLPFIIGPMF